MDNVHHAGAADAEPEAGSPGATLLRELRDKLSRRRIAATLHDYVVLSRNDEALSKLWRSVSGRVDLGVGAHRDAVLTWLREWGCRHLRAADNDFSSRSLAQWWTRSRRSLPQGTSLLDLTDDDLIAASTAYADLATAPAAFRSLGSRNVDVTFGETAAAKTLFANGPLLFPAWDGPIRNAFGSGTSKAERFRSFLSQVTHTLGGLANRLSTSVAELPRMLGRPEATPPKIIDEYLWMRITRRVGRADR